MKRIDYLLGGEDFKTLTAAQCMEQNAIYFNKDASGGRIASALTLGGFGSVPIVDQKKIVVGLVSEFDLLRAIMEGKDLEEVTAGMIMTKDPVCVTEETKAMEIVTLLDKKHLIRVPVTDKKGCLRGVVARRDLLRGYLKARQAPPPWW